MHCFYCSVIAMVHKIIYGFSFYFSLLWLFLKIPAVNYHFHARTVWNSYPFCFVRLGNVSLDIALEGYNPNTSKAMAVEQCQCPQPYKGLSCEDCAPGYYRSQTGPYGGYCVPCQCNGHSETCDEVTGICYVSVFHYRTVSARCRALDADSHGERVVWVLTSLLP